MSETTKERLEKFPLQYNQMAVNGLLVLDNINVGLFKESLSKNLKQTDYQIHIKYQDREGHGGFILKRLTDSEYKF